jgi:hypothetical protein
MTTEPRKAPVDRHPLLPVFVAGAIAMTGALLLVGSILMWLALRHTGINAPWQGEVGDGRFNGRSPRSS